MELLDLNHLLDGIFGMSYEQAKSLEKFIKANNENIQGKN